ncbi:kinase-like domain-containing protein [Rhizophagus diaphanus]|nr:kinase-like domain-containing protein [Rhizophagus diaphanus] [Rhizophagus sp. MUCL 43196]
MLKAIHRDLHSVNILFSQFNDFWNISDLGFCGPADKSSKSIYGNLPYIAPEVIIGKGYTFASDIYSIAILIPEIMSDIPLEYKNLMVQCWDADPLKRLDIESLQEKISKIHLSYQNIPDEFFQPKAVNNFEIKTSTNYVSSRLFTSKVHQFENLPEPKNATEEEQEVEDFNNSNDEKINKTSKINSGSKRLSELFNRLQISSKNDIQNDHKKETMQQMKGSVNDGDEIHNNPNLHSEDQDEFEIPDG